MFLTSQVLNNASAQQKLKLWLSAAYSAYVLEFKFARRPKVWLLTGLYVLEGARTLVSRGRSTNVSAGVASSIIGALSGVPVGVSVSLEVGSSWEMTTQVPEPHVWAAQFRLLDVRYLKMGKGGVDDVKLPVSMGLYRDFMSVSTARGGESHPVELGLAQVERPEDEDELADQDSQELTEYETRLEQAVKLFEMAPSHLLK